VETEPELPRAISHCHDQVSIDSLDSRHLVPSDIDVYRGMEPEPEVRHLEVPDLVVTTPAGAHRAGEIDDLAIRL
jgi:hypothetical protein